MHLALFLPLLLLKAAITSALGACPPLGSALPASQSPSSNTVVQQTVAEVKLALQNFTASLNSTAFSIGVLSTHEQTPLLEFHHTPATFNKSGTHKVSGDTIYRIASVSKAFTGLAIQQLSSSGKLNLQDRVTKYVPELAQLQKEAAQVNSITTVSWHDVTIEALASHLAGISADMGDEDIANQPAPYASLGLPPVNSVPHSNCGDAQSQRGCTRADFFANFGKKHAVYAPYTTPVYSNIGYSILGFVIEAVTGQSYEAYLNQHVLQPLKLEHTSVNAPANSSVGFIPVGSNWWGTPLIFDVSSGNLYSSTSDLLTFGVSILRSTLLPPSITRSWLKPRTFTSSVGVSIGAPWEIARASNITLDGRLIDVYTKAGDLPGYSSIIALIPDYEIVIAANIAGSEGGEATLQGLLSQVIEALVPAIDAAARQKAQQVYASTYTNTATNSTMTLSINDGAGLVVSNFSVRGADVLGAYAELIGADPATTSMRLYPTNLQAGNQTAWRAVYSFQSVTEIASQDAQLFFADGSCQSWSAIDLASYGLTGLDEFVLEAGDGGVVEMVNARAWRMVMERSG